MASHAREGHKAERREPRLIDDAAPAAAPPQSPLDFTLAVMRDPLKPDALRASLAKAALPYVHGRWCPLGSDPRDAQVGSTRDTQVGFTRLAPLNNAQLGQARHPSGRVAASETSGRVGFVSAAPHPPRLRPAPSPEGEGEEKKSMADIKLPQRRSRDDTGEETREQHVERDPYDPHPGYRWI